MRRSLVKSLALAGAAIGVGAAILFIRAATPTTAGAIDKDVQRLLDQLVIPKLELHEATLPEAIEVLNRALARSPEAARFRVAVWTQSEPPPGFLPKPPSSVGFPLDDADPRITVVLTNIPLSEAARYIGNLGGIGKLSCQKGDTLYFVKGSLGPFVERTVTIHPKSRLASFHDAKAVEEAFKASGFPFPEGSEIRFLSSDRLLVRTPADEVDGYYMYLRFDSTVGERLSYWKENWRSELRWRLIPRPPPTGPICHVGEPLNDSW